MQDKHAVKLSKLCSECNKKVMLDVVRFYILLEKAGTLKYMSRSDWIKPSWICKSLIKRSEKYTGLTSHCHNCGEVIL